MSKRKSTVEVDHSGMIRFDVNTTSGNGSSMNQFTGDPNTEVYHGAWSTHVKMKDLRIEVILDSYKGNWKDGKWAREQAWKAVKENLTQEMWMKVVLGLLEFGEVRGRKALQKDIRGMLKTITGVEHEYY